MSLGDNLGHESQRRHQGLNTEGLTYSRITVGTLGFPYRGKWGPTSHRRPKGPFPTQIPRSQGACWDWALPRFAAPPPHSIRKPLGRLPTPWAQGHQLLLSLNPLHQLRPLEHIYEPRKCLLSENMISRVLTNNFQKRLYIFPWLSLITE